MGGGRSGFPDGTGQVEKAAPPSQLPTFPPDEDLQKWKDAIIEIQAKSHDKAMAYTNLIIIAGYASAFTLWSFTRAAMSPRAMAVVAIFLGFSIAVFVAFEIYKMRYSTADALKRGAILGKTIPIPQMLGELATHEAEANRKLLKVFIPLWATLFWLAVLPAAIAGGLLFYSFFATLFCWPQWP